MSSKVKISYNSEGSSDSEESVNLDTMSPDKSSEEVREGDDGDIETSDEEFDSSDDSSSEKEGDKSSGLANVLSKLLAKQVNDKRVILAKGKTEKEILAARLRKEDSDGSDEDSKNNGQLDDEYALKRARQLKKKKWENMGRIKPKVLDRERERKLQRVATRGVVQLFNAVQKQQKTIKDKLNAVGSSVRKQDKVLQAVKKGDFIDALKKSDIQSEAISKNSTNDAEDMDKPSWSILKDDFMMGAKMKDWDKETDSEGEQAMEQGGDYSDSE